jgi:Leucine-rich repeat (LRR) protein
MTLEVAATKAPEDVKHIKLSKKHLSSFPQNVAAFVNLESLSLQGLKLTSVPNAVFNFKNLKYLDLSKNKIEILPDDLCQLTQIEVLILNRNPLTFLPQCVGNHLTRLKAIDLYETEISNLPSSLESVETLKFIDFQGIQMRQEEIDELKKRFPLIQFVFDPPCNCFK